MISHWMHNVSPRRCTCPLQVLHLAAVLSRHKAWNWRKASMAKTENCNSRLNQIWKFNFNAMHWQSILTCLWWNENKQIIFSFDLWFLVMQNAKRQLLSFSLKFRHLPFFGAIYVRDILKWSKQVLLSENKMPGDFPFKNWSNGLT